MYALILWTSGLHELPCGTWEENYKCSKLGSSVTEGIFDEALLLPLTLRGFIITVQNSTTKQKLHADTKSSKINYIK